MPQLKASFIKRIHDAINDAKFTLDDFDVNYPETGKTLATIKFLHHPEYYLSLHEETKREPTQVTDILKNTYTEKKEYLAYYMYMAPASHKKMSTLDISGPEQFIEAIAKWCDFVRLELYALYPVRDPLDDLRAKLNADLEKLVTEPDKFFSEEEAEAVDRRFDGLLKELAEMKDAFAISKGQLDELAKEFAEFKNSARVYPKGVWAKITSNKLVRATGKLFNTPEGRKFLFKQIGQVIGWNSGSPD